MWLCVMLWGLVQRLRRVTCVTGQHGGPPEESRFYLRREVLEGGRYVDVAEGMGGRQWLLLQHASNDAFTGRCHCGAHHVLQRHCRLRESSSVMSGGSSVP